ncbi:MAG TPA: hypothetical protein VGG26_10420 [Terracidiphilus sp.]|jgi:hypothetical protein
MVSSPSSATPWSAVSGCPVSLQATQLSSANMMQVQKGPQDQPQQRGQRLHLAFTSRESKQITAATVAVRGFTFTPGPMNAAIAVPKSGAPSSSLVTRTVQMVFAPQTGATLGADILVPDVSAAQTIDLVALRYGDGTSWKPTEGQICRVTPDPLLLVGASSR